MEKDSPHVSRPLLALVCIVSAIVGYYLGTSLCKLREIWARAKIWVQKKSTGCFAFLCARTVLLPPLRDTQAPDTGKEDNK